MSDMTTSTNDSKDEAKGELSVEDLVRSAMESVKPLYYKWVESDDRFLADTVNEINQIIISEGRKMAEYAISHECGDGNQLMRKRELRDEARTRLSNYIREMQK